MGGVSLAAPIRLQVHTSNASHAGADRFDVTHKSVEGSAFAPSKTLRESTAAARRRIVGLVSASRDLAAMGEDEGPLIEEARAVDREAWETYAPAYVAEMRRSWVEQPSAWANLLARSHVVLVCHCTDPTRCHRTLLAEILVKLGATYYGEVASPQPHPEFAR